MSTYTFSLMLLVAGNVAFANNAIVMHYRYDIFNQEISSQLINAKWVERWAS